MSRLTDHFAQRPSGLFVLNIFRRGELIDVWQEPNLIVDNSKQIHAKLLGGLVANQSITHIGFGTSLTPPAAGNTTLTAAYVKPLDAITFPTASQVAFAFSLGATEANGKAIGEFGLLTAGGALYARKTRSSALNKESDLSFAGAWTISF